MAVIPSDIRFVGIGTQVDMTERKTENLNALTQPYTMQDIIDTVSGGGSSVMNAGTGNLSIVGSGSGNTASGNFSFAGGGQSVSASGIFSSAVGGQANAASGSCSAIGGGSGNTASAGLSTISGGRANTASGLYSTIGGGWSNSAIYAGAIAGGNFNQVLGDYGAIGGGTGNYAGTPGNFFATVGGGGNNYADSYSSTIAGGGGNRVTAYNSFIGGGRGNTVSGVCSSVLAGHNNTTSVACSHAIGSNLTANVANYTFVNNLCNVGGGTSDARLKENIQPLTFGLQELSELEPVEYNFIDDESKKTKYGFLAQNIQAVMPSLITYHPTDLVDGEPILQFDKDAVWSSMVNALKELQERIVKLESK